MYQLNSVLYIYYYSSMIYVIIHSRKIANVRNKIVPGKKNKNAERVVGIHLCIVYNLGFIVLGSYMWAREYASH
jgi:hypothetical protein